MSFITPEEFGKRMWEAFEETCKKFNLDDAAKVRLLNNLGDSMFYSGGPSKSQEESPKE